MRQTEAPASSMANSYGPLHPSKIDKGVAASVAAATRQKSCNACVRGKRRCDKKAPKCTRCSSKGLDCVYARVPPGATADSVLLDDDYFSSNLSSGRGDTSANSADTHRDSASAATSVSNVPDFTTMGAFVDMPSLAGSSTENTSPESSLDYGLDASDASIPANGTMRGHAHAPTTNTAAPAEFMHLDDMSGFSIADLLAANDSSLNPDLWDMQGFPFNTSANANPTALDSPTQNNINSFTNGINPGGLEAATLAGKIEPRPLEIVPAARPIRDLSMLNERCETETFDPLEVHDARSRPGHILQFYTNIHITFSQTRALPFLHCRLYTSNLPKSLMTAFCVASAYRNRTPETKGWTVKLIQDATREVYAEGENAATPVARLARMHALVIMNSLRMLDGDIGLRATAEKEFGVFVQWTTDLIALRDELEKGMSKSQLTDRAQPPKSWESWLLLESTRRTIIAAISFICLISILKGETPECELWGQHIHFTASRHLWDAQTSVEFYRAWREKPRFLIEQMQYREFWQYASPDDLDEFTRIMLTTQTGMEAMDHFMLGDTSVTA
ncbi:fungal zn(2)-Cys(6) binuclear cluster domain-containing protein [Sarocladium implicatum]|nr:fungal zn(2)-Cys(6) binuclear cluster domain-containing protein [Sarocladium implicatum]